MRHNKQSILLTASLVSVCFFVWTVRYWFSSSTVDPVAGIYDIISRLNGSVIDVDSEAPWKYDWTRIPKNSTEVTALPSTLTSVANSIFKYSHRYKVYTFFDPQAKDAYENDINAVMLDRWTKVMTSYGFTPIVLTLEDCAKHPSYALFSRRSVFDDQYKKKYSKWFAYAGICTPEGEQDVDEKQDYDNGRNTSFFPFGSHPNFADYYYDEGAIFMDYHIVPLKPPHESLFADVTDNYYNPYLRYYLPAGMDLFTGTDFSGVIHALLNGADDNILSNFFEIHNSVYNPHTDRFDPPVDYDTEYLAHYSPGNAALVVNGGKEPLSAAQFGTLIDIQMHQAFIKYYAANGIAIVDPLNLLKSCRDREDECQNDENISRIFKFAQRLAECPTQSNTPGASLSNMITACPPIPRIIMEYRKFHNQGEEEYLKDYKALCYNPCFETGDEQSEGRENNVILPIFIENSLPVWDSQIFGLIPVPDVLSSSSDTKSSSNATLFTDNLITNYLPRSMSSQSRRKNLVKDMAFQVTYRTHSLWTDWGSPELGTSMPFFNDSDENVAWISRVLNL